MSILAATLWISFSEFVRNQLVFSQLWVDHYASLGLKFPAAPVNGIIWVIWSLILAAITHQIAQKFSLWRTTFLVWSAGFVLMWLVIGNLNVLPFKLLLAAIPLSLLEAFVAVYIIKKLGT